MDVIASERPLSAFQQTVTPDVLVAMCCRAFGDDVVVDSAVELGGGRYNTTYQINLIGVGPVVLRVAPAQARQFRIERNLMRNEYVTTPYLAPIAQLVPRTLMADFTHQLIDRDYMFQEFRSGEQVGSVLKDSPPPRRAAIWRRLGEITNAVHGVRGDQFRDVAGRPHPSWSVAVTSWFIDVAADLDDEGCDAGDVREMIDITSDRGAILDEITEPRLLHGDLWLGNVLIDRLDGEAGVTAVLDGDRACWGDPWSDWTMFSIGQRADADMGAFWDGYGSRPPEGPSANVRALIYEARHLGEVRLERHRLGHVDGVEKSHHAMRAVIEALTLT